LEFIYSFYPNSYVQTSFFLSLSNNSLLGMYRRSTLLTK
jgi:hypothetical protein